MLHDIIASEVKWKEHIGMQSSAIMHKVGIPDSPGSYYYLYVARFEED